MQSMSIQGVAIALVVLMMERVALLKQIVSRDVWKPGALTPAAHTDQSKYKPTVCTSP